jgi:hypothetical protein
VNQSVIQAAIAGVMPATVATGLFVSLFTAQAPSGAFGPTGAPDGLYADVAGLVNIPCTAPPPSANRVQATTVRDLAEITASELHHVLLAGYFPALDLGWRGEGTPKGEWQAIVDGWAYTIMGVESDSQSQMTRVQVKLETL